MNGNILQTRGLSVKYASGFRFHEIDYSVGRGEIAAIVGESGSGKSTFARAVSHMHGNKARVTGSVLIGGADIYACGPKELEAMRMREFSIVFQNSRELLNPSLRVESHLFEVLEKKYPKAELKERAAELLSECFLSPGVSRMYPAELSGGMAQRVSIACAIALRPGLVVMDEPTSSLDAVSRDKLLSLISRLNREHGMAFLIVTHDFSVARAVASRISVFYRGHWVEDGDTADVLENPLHPYTRGFINSSMDINPWRDVWGIRNVVDDSVRISDGCPFSDRCPQSLPECGRLAPHLSNHSEQGRLLACNRGGIAVLLEARRISKAFGQNEVLKDLSLKLYTSEITALVGPSGCGKSTLASILSGYAAPGSGSVLMDGKTVTGGVAEINGKPVDLRSVKGGVQMIFQDPETALNQGMSVLHAVTEPLIIGYPQTDMAAEAKRLLADVGLPCSQEFLSRRVGTLSSGQKQRVLAARALALSPRLIIADEMTSMLDASSKANLIRMLKGVQNSRGLTMLYITHDLKCALKIADKIYEFEKGGLKRLKADEVAKALCLA